VGRAVEFLKAAINDASKLSEQDACAIYSDAIALAMPRRRSRKHKRRALCKRALPGVCILPDVLRATTPNHPPRW